MLNFVHVLLAVCTVNTACAFSMEGSVALLQLRNKTTLAIETSRLDHCDLETWRRFVDGEFASGPDAFGDSFIGHMTSAWDWLQNKGDGLLSIEDVIEMQALACPTECPIRDSGGHGYGSLLLGCTQGITAESADGMMKGVLEDVIDIQRNEDGSVNSLSIKYYMNRGWVMNKMENIIKNYTESLKDQTPLHALANFMRSWAWLHPFTNCNGRTRALLLQHELKRLGLACGAFMYNNNGRVYLTTTDEFEEMLQEGIDVADIGNWNDERRQLHQKNSH